MRRLRFPFGANPAGVAAQGHDVPLDVIVTPERVIDCRRDGPRPAAAIDWDDLTEEKIAAIPLLAAQRELAQKSR